MQNLVHTVYTEKEKGLGVGFSEYQPLFFNILSGSTRCADFQPWNQVEGPFSLRETVTCMLAQRFKEANEK